MADAIDSLSPAAQARLCAGLPVLLQAVRGRRRRRAALRGVAVVLVATAIASVAWPRGASSLDLGPGPAPAATPVCAVVHDDPAIVARCTVADVERAAWFVDDAGLRTLLRQADRPDGLVRVSGRVFVAAAALDPFPATSP